MCNTVYVLRQKVTPPYKFTVNIIETSFNIHVYKIGINGIGIPYLRLFLRPCKGLPRRFSFNTKVYRLPNQVPAV